MKRVKRVLCALFTLCLAFLTALPVSAKEEEYTYTVRFFSGRQGFFAEGEMKEITGLHYGDRISFSQSAVTLNDNSKYYIRGIRESGKDNSESTQASSFLVTGDRDYVVAYGILGDATSYTINYVDTEGNALAPSETYYGNVGDRPVVAYLYIEGWQPQAYNITKTLEKDPAANVFNFIYTRVQQPSPAPGPDESAPTPGPDESTPGPDEPAPTPGSDESAPGPDDTPGTTDGEPPVDDGITVIPAEPDDAVTPPADDGPGPDDAGTPPADDGTAQDDAGTPPGGGGEGEEVEDERTPQGAPEEMQNLDDERVPTSNFLTIAADARLLGIPLLVIIALVFGAAAALWYFLIVKRKKEEEEEESKS